MLKRGRLNGREDRGLKMRCEPDKVTKIACIGVGTIGGGWVANYLARGLEVYAYDPNAKTLNGLRSAIQAVWPSLEQLGLADGASIEKLTLCSSLQDAVNGVQYVQASIIERKDQKIQLFHELGELLPEDVIFSTSSSRFVPSELGIKCRAPQRVIVGHPFSPVY